MLRWISLIAAVFFGGVLLSAADTISPPPSPCGTFGTIAGTCVQGNDARLGAGAVTGAIKSNGSNTFAQAASSDLSDAGAWSTSSPTLSCGTGTVTTATVSVRYKQFLGKVVAILADINISSLGTCSATISFTAPVAPNSAIGTYPLAGFDGNTGLALTNAYANGGNGLITLTPTSVAAHTYIANGTYEAQ